MDLMQWLFTSFTLAGFTLAGFFVRWRAQRLEARRAGAVDAARSVPVPA